MAKPLEPNALEITHDEDGVTLHLTWLSKRGRDKSKKVFLDRYASVDVAREILERILRSKDCEVSGD